MPAQPCLWAPSFHIIESSSFFSKHSKIFTLFLALRLHPNKPALPPCWWVSTLDSSPSEERGEQAYGPAGRQGDEAAKPALIWEDVLSPRLRKTPCVWGSAKLRAPHRASRQRGCWGRVGPQGLEETPTGSRAGESLEIHAEGTFGDFLK